MHSAQQLLRKFTNLKTLPHVAIRLSALLSEEKTYIQEFEGVIKLDPVLVTRILRVANSAFFGLREKVSSISRALVFLGTKNLRNMVATEAIKDILNCKTDGDAFSRKNLWLHCAAVSILAQMISERVFGRRGEDAYLCGILHDIGLIIEDQTVPELFASACKAVTGKSLSVPSKPLTEIEKEVIGTDHCAVGFLLSEDWKLNEDVKKGIRDHHLISEDLQPSSMTGLIQLANFFACKLNYPALPGLKGGLSPSLVRYVKENSEEFKVLLGEIPAQMAAAKELYDDNGTRANE
jgi:putative nucleotidyltransferase with HDIG domain